MDIQKEIEAINATTYMPSLNEQATYYKLSLKNTPPEDVENTNYYKTLIRTCRMRYAILSQAKKEFLTKIGDTLTDEEVLTWIETYAKREPEVSIRTKWHYAMGHIGSAETTIAKGLEGKQRPLDRYRLPDWRPICHVEWHTQGWNNETIKCERFLQSWDEILESLDEYGGQTYCIYKHPKQ